MALGLALGFLTVSVGSPGMSLGSPGGSGAGSGGISHGFPRFSIDFHGFLGEEPGGREEACWKVK